MSDINVISKIIDSPIEELESTLRSGSYNITVLLNLKKGLELQYQRVEVTKNMLISEVKNGTVDKLAGTKSIDELYIAMQLIEDRATIVQRYIDEKKARFS